jgi:hypothetical protein
MNLRSEKVKKFSDDIIARSKSNNCNLTKKLIEYLEYLVPLHWGIVFKGSSNTREGFDSVNTRLDLLDLVNNKTLSLYVARKEIRRRRYLPRV